MFISISHRGLHINDQNSNHNISMVLCMIKYKSLTVIINDKNLFKCFLLYSFKLFRQLFLTFGRVSLIYFSNGARCHFIILLWKFLLNLTNKKYYMSKREPINEINIFNEIYSIKNI